MAHIALMVVCAALAAWQLARVPRLWAFVLLFIAMMPKVPLAFVPGNTTPLRIDDLVIGAVLAVWTARFFTVWQEPETTTGPAYGHVPPSPATFFFLIYWYTAAVCTLLGIW